VPYLQAGTALVSVSSGGTFAVGTVTVSVDGAAYKSVLLFAGISVVKLPKTLASGTHTVSAQYGGSTTSLAGSSAVETLTVGKAPAIASTGTGPTLASKTTGQVQKTSDSTPAGSVAPWTWLILLLVIVVIAAGVIALRFRRQAH